MSPPIGCVMGKCIMLIDHKSDLGWCLIGGCKANEKRMRELEQEDDNRYYPDFFHDNSSKPKE